MKILGTVLITVLLSSMAFAQWTKTNGPEGGSVGVFYNDQTSGYIFAGGNGFFRSTDNGASWSESSAGMSGEASPVAVVRAGSKLYAVSLDKFYVSTDNGSTWNQSSANIPAQALSMIAVGNTIIVGTNVFGVYYSTNDGSSWTAGTGFQPSNNIVQTFAFTGARLLAGLGGKRIWASTDTGKTWAQYGSGTLFGASHTAGSLIVHGSKVFAACSDSGVFVSTDGGTTWTQSSTGMNPRAMVAQVASNGSSLYAHVVGAYTGVDTGVIYRSTNDGGSWFSVKSDLYSTLGQEIGFGAGKVFYANYAGIYASTNDGGHWFPSNSGLKNVLAIAITVSGSTLFIGHSGGVAKTDDGGTTWAVANNGIPGNTPVSGMATHGSFVFAGTSNGVLRSSDNGASWVSMSNGLTGLSLYVGAMAAGGASVYASTFGGIFVSANDGASWSGPGTGTPFGNASMIYVDGTDLWAAFGSDGVYHSTDNGSSWAPMNNGLPPFGKNVTSITRNGSTLFAGLAAASGSSVYASTDNGANWTGSSTNIPGASYVTVLFAVNGSVFAGFNYGGGVVASGMYRTTDDGANWAPVNDGLPDPYSVNLIASFGGYIYASGLGVWRRPLSEVTAVEEISSIIPAKFNLSQNYPNPFNPKTSFEVRIADFGFVRLAVYDILGKEVATLISQDMQPGTYRVSWDANRQSSGMYYCRLTTGKFSETRSMVLTK